MLFGCLMCVLFFYIVSSWSLVVLTYLLACKCVIQPCFLTFDVMLSFFPMVVFPCFYSSLFFLCSLLFICLFVLVVFSLGVTEAQIKSENISKFWLSSSASGPASPHFHLAQIITLLGQEKNLSKNLFFVAFMLGLLAMCWNTYFYCVFTHHPNFAYKWAPRKTIMFHKMQNKNPCFRNGLLRKTKTFMFTKTQNLNNENRDKRKGLERPENRKPKRNRTNWWKEAFHI